MPTMFPSSSYSVLGVWSSAAATLPRGQPSTAASFSRETGLPLAISRSSGSKRSAEPSLLRRRLAVERRSAISTKVEVSIVWRLVGLGWSARAARKLLHVFSEGLCCQLQPLDHRQIGEQLIGQFLYRHAVTYGEHRCLNQLPRFLGHGLYADESPATFLDDQLDEAACVEVGERTRHVVQG